MKNVTWPWFADSSSIGFHTFYFGQTIAENLTFVYCQKNYISKLLTYQITIRFLVLYAYKI